jgi:cytoplasmic iron level regulating protein YaaA (DUF328/UPF0246 family)
MISVLSPAKTLDFESKPKTKKFTEPEFLPQAECIAKQMRKMKPAALRKLMGISEKLAEQNAERYQEWSLPFTPQNAKAALLAFKGDVYLGLEVENYSAGDFTFAQKRLRILSGLYGVLRPLDLIQAYRLEMGTSVKIGKSKDLYAYWDTKITEALNRDLAETKSKALVNLASNEYFKSIKTKQLNAEVITPVFKDYKNGKYKIISFFAKKARGYMASYIVQNRLKRPQDLKAFDVAGYRFDAEGSDDKILLFLRDEVS